MSGADTAVNHSPLDASAFVAPRNLLARPALPAADKEQIESLVGHTGACLLESDARADTLPENYTRLSEVAHQLRCAAHKLPPDSAGHGTARQEEPEYPQPERQARPCIIARIAANVGDRHRLCAAVGLQVVHVRWLAYHLGLHQRHPVLLAESRRLGQGRPVPPEQPSR
jgi:hypothetical protein